MTCRHARHRTPCAPTPVRARDDTGTVTAFTVILTLAAFAFAGLVLDGGLAVATKVQAVTDAQSAARAGARELDVAALRRTGAIRLDPAHAEAGARAWLSRAGQSGTVTVDATTGDTVTVTIRTSRRTQLLHLLGQSSIPITATATARAVQP